MTGGGISKSNNSNFFGIFSPESIIGLIFTDVILRFGNRLFKGDRHPRDSAGDRGSLLQVPRNVPSISFGNPDKMSL